MAESRVDEFHDALRCGLCAPSLQHCFFFEDKVVKLDGGNIHGSRFINCRIRFTEHPVGLNRVQFINCVFEMPTVTSPNKYLIDSAKAILASASLSHIVFPSHAG